LLASAHLQDFLRATAAKTPGNVESSVTFPVAKRSDSEFLIRILGTIVLVLPNLKLVVYARPASQTRSANLQEIHKISQTLVPKI